MRVQHVITVTPEGRYVRVYGTFKGAGLDNPSALGTVNMFNARSVRDHNEVCPDELQINFLCAVFIARSAALMCTACCMWC